MRSSILHQKTFIGRCLISTDNKLMLYFASASAIPCGCKLSSLHIFKNQAPTTALVEINTLEPLHGSSTCTFDDDRLHPAGYFCLLVVTILPRQRLLVQVYNSKAYSPWSLQDNWHLAYEEVLPTTVDLKPATHINTMMSYLNILGEHYV